MLAIELVFVYNKTIINLIKVINLPFTAYELYKTYEKETDINDKQ
jgi:hypothetical protein